MHRGRRPLFTNIRASAAAAALAVVLALPGALWAQDLQDIKQSQVLRHVGVPYANFVTGSGDGLDVELMKLFAQHLGVRYEFVRSSCNRMLSDLTGTRVAPRGGDLETLGHAPIRGDVLAGGVTVLPWREKVVDFSEPTFASQVWLVAAAASPLRPITPTRDLERDISTVKALLPGHLLLGKAGTSLDPGLYALAAAGARVKFFPGRLNDLAPAIFRREAELTLLDAPDALMALEKWPGRLKIIGPVSGPQVMACAFRKTSPHLREAFNRFLAQCKEDGTYWRLVKKYYPAFFTYYRQLFAKN